MAHGMPTPHWPLTFQTHSASTSPPKITTNTLIHSPLTISPILPSLCVFLWHAGPSGVCVLANLNHPGPICITFQRISILIEDYVSRPMTLRNRDTWAKTWSEISIKLFEECIWIWALVLNVHEPVHPVWPAPALYDTIDPLTPLHVQLSVFNLPSNSDDLGLHIDVVWKSSLCFACVWINRCRCLRRASVRLTLRKCARV